MNKERARVKSKHNPQQHRNTSNSTVFNLSQIVIFPANEITKLFAAIKRKMSKSVKAKANAWKRAEIEYL